MNVENANQRFKKEMKNLKLEELNLTSKTKEIIYDIFQNTLPDVIVTSEELPNNSSVHYDDIIKKYVIAIGICNDTETYEMNLLHELTHLWQIKNGFKQLFIKNPEYSQYQELCNVTNSFVLDFNVTYILSKYKLHSNKIALKNKYERIKGDVNFISKNKEICECFEDVDYINLAIQCASIFLSFNKDKGRNLIFLTNQISPKISTISNIFIKSICENDYKTSENVNKIFEFLLENIALFNYAFLL